jgi:hypothetical protein
MRTSSPAIILKGHSSCVYDLHFDDFKIGILDPFLPPWHAQDLGVTDCFIHTVSASKDRGLITWDFKAPRPRDRLTVATLDGEGCYVFDAAFDSPSASIPAPAPTLEPLIVVPYEVWLAFPYSLCRQLSFIHRIRISYGTGRCAQLSQSRSRRPSRPSSDV